MNDNKFSYMLLDQNKSNIEDSSDFSENEYKKKDFKIQKYEKFKPKSILKKDNNNKKLKGAENKVKNLLSHFLKNIESEDNNSSIIFKSIKTLRNKDKESLPTKKNILKRINTTNDDDNLVRTNSFNISIDNNYKNEINKNNKNNKDFLGETSPKSSLFSKIFTHKKVTFNLNPYNIGNNNEIHKERNYLSKKKTKKKFSSKNINKKKDNIFKRTSSYSIEFSNGNKKPLMSENGKNSNLGGILNARGLSTKSNIKNIRSLIKKTDSSRQNSSLNFKNDGYILYKNINDNKKKKRNKFLNFANIQNKKIKNNIINESFNNSIFSENSENNINKKSIDLNINNKLDESIRKDKNSIISSNVKKSYTVIKKKFSTILTKRSSIDLTDISHKNSSKNVKLKSSLKLKKTPDLKHSIDIKKVKRCETAINQLMTKSNYKRLNTHFKSLKEKLKKTIILRPEDFVLPFEEEKEEKVSINSLTKKKYNSYKKRHSSKLINNMNFKGIYKNKKSSNSNKNIFTTKNLLKKINLSLISKSEIPKKNYSNKSVKGQDIDKYIEQTTTSQKINIETEPQKTTTIEKKEASKSESFEDYSMNSIKRKNTIYYEKYRILQHKGIVYDSLDDEEIDDQEDINSFYLDPNSIFSIIFDSILFLVSIISLFEVPLYLALNHDFCKDMYFTVNDLINFFIEFLNIIDLFLGFFRAYYNWDEQLISKNTVIARKYLTSWFLLDLMASVPVYTIIKIYEPVCNHKELSTNYYNVILDKLYYLFICNRLFKILKIFWENQAWKIISNKLNDNMLLIVNICLVLGALNYTACFYIYIARNSYPNWILHTSLETKPFIDIYISAIYILIMALTTVGYGDITCYSLAEIIFQILLLVVGIMAYSWLVSSFSNYIQKLNEKSVDFEKKKSILDEIKLNNPNLPDKLYERILRYLKFKNFHEKKLKNIIFDCLPVGLKNNLISEMYKPIIKNFIFFKNFENTDFIVRVILSFKPIMAYKNDILVNEGDMVEDIMFVRKGVLSVELPINMTNPQENIDKYLNTPLLKIEKGPNIQKIGNSTIIPSKHQKFKNMLNSINENKKISKLISLKNCSSLASVNSSSFGNKTTLDKKRTIKKETTYVKILGIRENEHFGDVLMFLEQRSPLRVRVRSKKSELFFLKKMDAVNISASYQNIWRRINKKSVFNFEQIKKSIKKIVELYCSVKKINSVNDEENSDDSLNKEFGMKETGIGVVPKNFDLNNSALRSKRNVITLRKCKSLNNERVKNFNEIFINNNIEDDYFQINSENINDKTKKCLSSKIFKRKLDIKLNNKNKLTMSPFSSSSTSSPSISSQTDKLNNSSKKNNNNTNKIKEEDNELNKKLIEVLNGNYKFYKNNNKNNDNNETKPDEIIKEEPEKESTMTLLKYSNSIQRLSKLSNFKNRIINNILTQNSHQKEKIKCINQNKDEELKNKNLYKINDSSSLDDYNKDNTNNFEKNKEKISESSYYNRIINSEMYPGEEIQLNNDENLLNKKLDFIPKENYDKFNKKNIEYKNSKLEELLKSFEKESQSSIIRDNNLNNRDSYNKNLNDFNEINEEKNIISPKDNDSSNYFHSNKNNVNLKNKDSSNNITSPINYQKKTNWDSNYLSINSNISFKIESSYENYNIISGDKLIKNKSLQMKLKNYLIDETLNFSGIKTNNNLIKKTNSLADPLYQNKNIFQRIDKPNKKLASSIIYNSNNNILSQKKTRKFGKASSILSNRSRTINSNNEKLDRKSSFYESNLAKIKKGKNKFQTGIGTELFGNSKGNIGMFNKLRKKKLSQRVSTIKNINTANVNNINNNSPRELAKRINRKRRNSVMVIGNHRNEKKKDNLLSLINFNIQKTNQNLNNPDEFYNNYFASLLGEIEKKNQKNNNNDNNQTHSSMIELPKIKKDKILINRNTFKK